MMGDMPVFDNGLIALRLHDENERDSLVKMK